MAKLNEKAVLVRLNIKQWSGRKHDRRVSMQVAEMNGASEDSGRYHKHLVAAPEIKKVRKIANEARNRHYENTLPWLDDGNRLLPSANYFSYTQEMRTFKDRMTADVEEFIEKYPALIQQAAATLNGMFDPADYPDQEMLRRKFSFETHFIPIPDGGDFRVTLNREEMDQMRSDVESRVRNAEALAMQDCWQRLYDVVSHISEKLSDPEAIFRDSLIGNAVKLVELLPRLNLNDDEALERMRREVESKLTRFGPETLRDDLRMRKAMAQDAEDILGSMSGYI